MIFKKVFRGYNPAQVDKYIAETAAREQQIRVAQKERIEQLVDENAALTEKIKQYQTDEQAISKSLIASQHLAEELKFDAEKYSELVLTRAKIFYATWRAYAQTMIASLSSDEVKAFNQLQRKVEAIINAYEGSDIEREIAEGSHAHAVQQQSEAHVPQVEQPQPEVEQSTVQQQLDMQSDIAESEPSDANSHPVSEFATFEHSAEAQLSSVGEQPSVAATEQQFVSTHSDLSPIDVLLASDEPTREVDVTPTNATMGVLVNPIQKVEQAADQVIDLKELIHTDMSLEDLCEELGLPVKKNK